ncbi:armadillo-type protein [Diplogelasinospora grovesii]|uniref:Deoxyhypusine hydroxylase n=1 Tax=Diplogelasinospora grovesii TaxID=303347 RepID=A0AAN6N8B3_9PEZI|nr:armadillo-type protein [Diplogelasinospora grovesii]
MTASTTVSALRESLCSESTPLPVRFRALFSLKHLARSSTDASESLAAVDAIAAAFSSPSALLKHELAYCLGQSGQASAIPPLTKVLEDVHEDAMCRHEAAEALGALGHAESLEVLRRYKDREGEEVVVKETCEIAIDRIEWENSQQRKQEKLRQSDFASVDPAPPMPQDQQEDTTVEDLEKRLMDTKLPLFQRYRAMFALRDLASPPDLPTAVPAVNALAKGFQDDSALFRHEIAFVFGQLAHPASIPALTAALSNTEEASMVRHEAAEALGSLGDEEGVEATLRKFLHDKEKVVRESIIVALDMAEYEQSGEAEYALIPKEVTA